MKHVQAVIDLGFGDAGKGLVTDALVRRHGARWVARFNGGSQAAHNVVTPDGRHHTFSSFGAGSFVPGVKTFLCAPTVLHPGALLVESAVLAQKGLSHPLEQLYISGGALVTTPFHQAANRLLELARAAEPHGSCGVGFGVTVEDALAHPADAIYARHLGDRPSLLARARRAQQRLWDRCSPYPRSAEGVAEWNLLSDPTAPQRWLDLATPSALIARVVDDGVLAGWLRESEPGVFEGAQGVLLDERYGFDPHTTWSKCTFENVTAVLSDCGWQGGFERIGVLRSHSVRHGPGPLPTQTSLLHTLVREVHNTHNRWQGPVRYGWLDLVLSRYALDVVGGIDGLVLTHLDALERLLPWPICIAYDDQAGRRSSRLEVPAASTLEHPSRFTERLRQVTPVLMDVRDEEALIAAVEGQLSTSVAGISRGPKSTDLTWRAMSNRQ